MTTRRRATLAPFAFGQLGRLRELLDVIEEIRKVPDPLTSLDGLKRTLELVLRLAELAGVEKSWLDRLRKILADEAILRVVLAVTQYALGLVGFDSDGPTLRATVLIREGADGASREEIVVDAEGFIEWLPLVLQLIRLVLKLRGE